MKWKSLYRFIEGVCDAATYNALISIWMSVFPNSESFAVAVSATSFGVGMSIGKDTNIRKAKV